MTPLIHNYTHKAGKKFEWDTSDNQERYARNIADPAVHQRLLDLGFVDRPIEYCFNSHGFRTQEFDLKYDVVAFGCSFTMGTGIHSQDSWPEQLARITGLQVANLGHAGSSNDTVFRFAQYYLKFLRPRYAVWLQTDRHRVELIDESVPMSLNIMAGDTRNPCAQDFFIKTWFSSDVNQKLNLEKNTMAFQYLCQSLDIKPIIFPREAIVTKPFPMGDARDLIHPGPESYKTLAHQVKDLLDEPATT
jgi:hypothetical protein